MLMHLQKARPFFPMLVADNFTPEALRACRAKGVIAVRPSTLFGEDVGRALGDLLNTLSNSAAYAAANPDRIESLLTGSSRSKGLRAIFAARCSS
jgi:hypothetical protein